MDIDVEKEMQRLGFSAYGCLFGVYFGVLFIHAHKESKGTSSGILHGIGRYPHACI